VSLRKNHLVERPARAAWHLRQFAFRRLQVRFTPSILWQVVSQMLREIDHLTCYGAIGRLPNSDNAHRRDLCRNEGIVNAQATKARRDDFRQALRQPFTSRAGVRTERSDFSLTSNNSGWRAITMRLTYQSPSAVSDAPGMWRG
jgi:hypothetical protein